MPVWNNQNKQYDEEPIEDFESMKREERFRTALLNELDGIARAIGSLDRRND